VGTIATAVTPPNVIVVAQIAYTERDKDAESRKEKIPLYKERESRRQEGSQKIWRQNVNRKTEKSTRLYERKNNEVENEKEVMALAKSQKSLKAWTKQKWRTKSGKPSTQGPKATGERYLPSAAIKALSPGEYAATTAAKRKGKAQGKQFVAQPKNIKKKVKKYRKVK
jgi:hypothetical protein